MIQHFKQNMKGRDFVVGDIHGMFRALEYKLIENAFDPAVDRLFSVGDLVDRGPDSIEFDEWLDKPWFHSVRGNHEQMLIDSVAEGAGDTCLAARLHYMNGGEWLYGLSTVEQQCYAIICQELPIGIEVETQWGLVGLVHAECPLDNWDLFKSMYATESENFDAVALWSRRRITAKSVALVEGVHKLYVGHTPLDTPTQYGNVVYTDTGSCFKGGHLSLLVIN